MPLARATALTGPDLERLPRPSSHDRPDFIASHAPTGEGAVAQCATCHARESCARCHVNAANLAPVTQLASDRRVAALVAGKAPVYPVPATHTRAGFKESHGPMASSPTATCASCHARRSCTTCHTGPGAARVIRRLADPADERIGVQLRSAAHVGPRRPATRPMALTPDTSTRLVRAHPGDFITSHPRIAASGSLTCEGCHAQRFCSDCHAGETRRAFHPPNFAAAHASDVYAADRECSSCHNTEVFCRDCHRATGLASRGGRSGTYHTAQGQWLLQHGRAARQELTTCTTCHQQSSCMRCHSTTGWGVSPHGPDFNAARLGRKAMAMCARCHIADPRRR